MISLLSVLSTLLAILSDDEEEFEDPYELANQDPRAAIMAMLRQENYEGIRKALGDKYPDFVLEYSREKNPIDTMKLVGLIMDYVKDQMSIAPFQNDVIYDPTETNLDYLGGQYAFNLLTHGFSAIPNFEELMKNFKVQQIYAETPARRTRHIVNFENLAGDNKIKIRETDRGYLTAERSRPYFFIANVADPRFDSQLWPKLKTDLAVDSRQRLGITEKIYVSVRMNHGYHSSSVAGLRFFTVNKDAEEKDLLFTSIIPSDLRYDMDNFPERARRYGYTVIPKQISDYFGFDRTKRKVFIKYLEPWFGVLPDIEIYEKVPQEAMDSMGGLKLETVGIWRRQSGVPAVRKGKKA